MAWENIKRKIEGIGSDLREFDIEFVDEHRFMDDFLDFLRGKERNRYERYMGRLKFIDITGYFSEGIFNILCYYRKYGCGIRLISPQLRPEKGYDRENLTTLRKLQNEGIEIRVSEKLHARLFLGYTDQEKVGWGVLLLGSFDFNRDSLGGQNRNAGIITSHPDLIRSAKEYFEKIWNDKYETKPLEMKD